MTLYTQTIDYWWLTPVWPTSFLRQSPVVGFHTRRVLSSEAVTSSVSDTATTARTLYTVSTQFIYYQNSSKTKWMIITLTPVCPVNLRRYAPVCESQIRAVLSVDPLAILPSGKIAIVKTSYHNNNDNITPLMCEDKSQKNWSVPRYDHEEFGYKIRYYYPIFWWNYH
jgi:hypothetical protein